MKSPTSSQGTIMFNVLLDQSLFGGLSAEYKKNDKSLDGQSAFGKFQVFGSVHPQ
jgi:hypothetical protein